MKFAIKPIQHYPPHLRYVATLTFLRQSVQTAASATVETIATDVL